MRIIVTGGRDYVDHLTIGRAFARVAADAFPNRITLVHGGASGADALAERDATARGWAIDPVPADWEGPCGPECRPGHRRTRADGTEFCPAAGPRRNQVMVDKGADLVIAFPGGSGTADCVRRARAAGIPVREVES